MTHRTRWTTVLFTLTVMLLMACSDFGSETAVGPAAKIEPLRATVPSTVVEYGDKATFLAALATPVVIDFDDLTGGTAVTGAEYAHLGVTFANADGDPITVLSSPPVAAWWGLAHLGSAPNALSSSYASTPLPGFIAGCCGIHFNDAHTDNVLFTFSPAVPAAGIHIGENDVDGVGVLFLDVHGDVIASRSFPRWSPADLYIGLTSSTPIGALQVLDVAGDGDGIVYDDLIFESVPDRRTVAIDVRPGSDDNPVNPRARGSLPVAILSDADFDATTVDPVTVVLGDGSGTGVPVGMRRKGSLRATVEDVNDDGDMDLLLHFDVTILSDNDALSPSTTELCVRAETRDGQGIEGCDPVRVVG